jgi:hypothetical protein
MQIWDLVHPHIPSLIADWTLHVKSIGLGWTTATSNNGWYPRDIESIRHLLRSKEGWYMLIAKLQDNLASLTPRISAIMPQRSPSAEREYQLILKRQQEAEEAVKAEEERQARINAEIEHKRLEAIKQKQAEEDAMKRHQEMEDAQRRQAEEDAIKRHQEMEDAQKKQAEEDALKKLQDLEDAQKKQAEEDALKKLQDLEDAQKKQAEEDAQKKQAEEDALVEHEELDDTHQRQAPNNAQMTADDDLVIMHNDHTQDASHQETCVDFTNLASLTASQSLQIKKELLNMPLGHSVLPAHTEDAHNLDYTPSGTVDPGLINMSMDDLHAATKEPTASHVLIRSSSPSHAQDASTLATMIMQSQNTNLTDSISSPPSSPPSSAAHSNILPPTQGGKGKGLGAGDFQIIEPDYQQGNKTHPSEMGNDDKVELDENTGTDGQDADIENDGSVVHDSMDDRLEPIDVDNSEQSEIEEDETARTLERYKASRLTASWFLKTNVIGNGGLQGSQLIPLLAGFFRLSKDKQQAVLASNHEDIDVLFDSFAQNRGIPPSQKGKKRAASVALTPNQTPTKPKLKKRRIFGVQPLHMEQPRVGESSTGHIYHELDESDDSDASESDYIDD